MAETLEIIEVVNTLEIEEENINLLSVEESEINIFTEYIPGETGKSAYETAVANGFEGTEEEWLESLQGEGSADWELVEW